jgi:hypothetical protein
LNSAASNIRNTIDHVASHNEDAVLALMRAAERTGDDLLKQQLFNVIDRLHQDMGELRQARASLDLKRT